MRASDMEQELRMAILTELSTPERSKEPMTFEEELELYSETWSETLGQGCIRLMEYSDDMREIMDIHMQRSEIAEFDAALKIVKHYSEIMDDIVVTRTLELEQIEERREQEQISDHFGDDSMIDDGGFEC